MKRKREQDVESFRVLRSKEANVKSIRNDCDLIYSRYLRHSHYNRHQLAAIVQFVKNCN